MKQVKLLLAVAAMSVGTLSITSCGSDETVCPTGFEGKDCDVEIRAKFLGTFSASDKEIGATDGFTYSAVVGKNSNVSKVNIGNFSKGYFDNDVIAGTISGNVITIDAQQPDADGYQVSGSGSITGDVLTITYTITELSSAGEIKYEGTWTK